MAHIAAHNVEVGRPAADVIQSVESLIKDTDAVIACLYEAGGYARALRAHFGRRGWRVLGARDAIVLVRESVPVRKVRRPGHHVPWLGPKAGVLHDGREWLRLDALLDGCWVRILAIHRVPGGPGKPATAKAWKREHNILARQAARAAAQVIPLLVLGDINDHTDNTAALSHRSLSEDTGGRLVRTTCAVDWATAWGAIKATGKRLGNYGSDHPAVHYTTKRGTK